MSSNSSKIDERVRVDLKETLKRINFTFYSILFFNYVLVFMGVAAFVMAILSAAGGEFTVAAVFSALGTVDVFSVFKFSMDRVQRSLGDQVQVETAKCGLSNQMGFVQKLESKSNNIAAIERINAEIRRATLYSMGLIQDFTKIAEPLKEKPWIRALPIRYGPLKLNGNNITGKEFTVTKGEPITLSGTIMNTRNKGIKLNKIMIAIRPPCGTPDGGPFRFDFCIEEDPTIVKPEEPAEIKCTKVIEKNMRTKEIESIPKEWFTKDWYAFMTCQTDEDGCWHDDHNKYWFELKKTEPKK